MTKASGDAGAPAPGTTPGHTLAPPPFASPPPPPPTIIYRSHLPRAGELSPGWRAGVAVTWVAVVISLGAVWNSSVQLGLSTWWLGPRADPQPLVIRFSPFVAPVLMLLGTINQTRWLARFGLGAAAVVVGVGIGDLGRVTSIAVTEILIGLAAAALSAASFTGTYRRDPAADVPDTATATVS